MFVKSQQAGCASSVQNSGQNVEIKNCLKVPKREIFDRSDFPDFYTIKSTWVGDLLVYNPL